MRIGADGPDQIGAGHPVSSPRDGVGVDAVGAAERSTTPRVGESIRPVGRGGAPALLPPEVSGSALASSGLWESESFVLFSLTSAVIA